MTTFEILKKTYVFVLLRFLLICATFAPIGWIVLYYMDFLILLFGLANTAGIVRNVFATCFGYVGLLVGWFVFEIVRKTLLFYVKAAHVIAITKICVEDAPVKKFYDNDGELVREEILTGALTGESIREMFRRFLSVNLFYMADGLVLKGLNEVGELLLKQEVLPQISGSNLIVKFFGSTIKTTLSYSDEIVLSYTYFRCRINELYGSESGDQPENNRSKATKHKTTVKTMLGYVVDGMCLYVKSCLPLMKTAFITVLMSTVFTWITAGLILVTLFISLNNGLFEVLLAFVVLRLIFAILSYTFLEPYETAALVAQFYAIITDEEVDMEVEDMQEKLSSMSGSFKSLFEKAYGKNKGETTTASTNSGIFEDNLFDLAKRGFSDAIKDDVLGDIADRTNDDS